jgi:serine/threonine protein kinase
LEPSAVASLLSDVCEALQFLHRQGLCHRDVKLENICIFENRAYLIDLEFVGQIEEKYMGIVGTLGYLPMNLLNKKSEHIVREADDVFALGIVSLQMFSGECLPWFPGIGFRCLSGLLRKVPEELQDSLSQMLDERPECRPNLINLATELEGFATWMESGL